MPIWPIYLIAAGLLACITTGGQRLMLVAICAGIALVALGKITLPEPVFWVFSGMIWVIIGALPILVQGDLPVIPAILLVVAGLAVFPAQFIGDGYALGNPFLVLSDILGVLAIAVLGSGAFASIFSGNSLGTSDRPSIHRNSMSDLDAQK